jgi:ribosome recycling factor
MKLNLEILLSEYENVVGGYTGLFTYRLANLCVKADPASLLSAVIETRGQKMNIEQVAKVGLRADDQLDVYPLHEDLMPPISKAVLEIHPEFKLSEEKAKLDNGKDYRYLRFTMPDVNKDRRDVLNNGVDVFFNECKSQMDAAKQKYALKMKNELQGCSRQDVDEAQEKFDNISDNSKKIANTLVEDKKKEIDEAYKRYCEKQTNNATVLNSNGAAQGASAKSSFLGKK